MLKVGSAQVELGFVVKSRRLLFCLLLKYFLEASDCSSIVTSLILVASSQEDGSETLDLRLGYFVSILIELWSYEVHAESDWIEESFEPLSLVEISKNRNVVIQYMAVNGLILPLFSTLLREALDHAIQLLFILLQLLLFLPVPVSHLIIEVSH